MYVPEYFKLYELIPEELYRKLEKQDKLYYAWLLLDDRMLRTADQLRDNFGKMVVNTWWWGGNNHNRGLRLPTCEIGAEYSQHKYGRGLDSLFTNCIYNIDKIRKFILKHPWKYPYIKRLEIDTPHLHFDIGNGEKENKEIRIIQP